MWYQVSPPVAGQAGIKYQVIIAVAVSLLYFCFLPAYGSSECSQCHQIEAESFALTKHAIDKNCDICHGSSEKHLTAEVKKDNIINPNGLNLKKGNGICLSCHTEKAKDVSERFVAVASLHDDLRCYECHTVHLKSSDEEADVDLFKDDLYVDCSLCHSNQAENFSDSGHGLSGIKCLDCHKPHEAKTISQDIEGEIDKCLSCHPAQELEFKSFYAHPLRQRQIRCSDCHNPHSNNYDKMLKKDADDLCGDCHAGIMIEGGKHPLSKNTNHPFKTVECLDCHRPHGSNFDKLLKHNIDNICKTCHN
ncbi:MAG: cytochrome c3 family protein [Candidatus Omnitrophota bacterium]|nr:cytochrome c3 family protein [Candidatus Omnitrophota bacterium]